MSNGVIRKVSFFLFAELFAMNLFLRCTECEQCIILMMVKISTEPSNSSGSAKLSREKRTETLREAKRKVGRECGVE